MVTGGAGFLGGHVVAELEGRGYYDVGVIRSTDFDLTTESGVDGALRRFEQHSSSREISIRDLAELISNEIGYRGTIRWNTSKPNGQPRRKLDISRARDEFGFVSSTDFETGLAETTRWYLQR